MTEITTGLWNILRVIALISITAVSIMFICDNFRDNIFSEQPKCAIYHGDFQNYTYDIPCDQVHSWCEEHDCEKTYGNCGRPTCFCNNTLGGRA